MLEKHIKPGIAIVPVCMLRMWCGFRIGGDILSQPYGGIKIQIDCNQNARV